MKRTHKQLSILSAALAMCLYACFPATRVSTPTMSNQYRADEHYLHPEFCLYNQNDSITLLYFKIDEGELLYIRRSQIDSFYAEVKIACTVTTGYDASGTEDTASVVLKFTSSNNTKKEYAVGFLPLRIKAGGTHLVTVVTSDQTSKKTELNYLTLDKTNDNSDHNFMLRDPYTGYIAFSRYIDSAATYSISYNHPVNKLYVSYYHRSFPVAIPPFSEIEPKPFKYKPDSTFIITPAKNGLMLITLNSVGFYHIQVDTSNYNGLTIFRFQKHFPEIGQVSRMVMPLRYITSNDEFEKIVNAKDVKQELDNFWLTTAGNTKERAKALIRNYYNRVQDANRFFTSYEEGWQTDRGMIYIIYGPPSNIYRSSGSEVWTYGEDKNYMSINFTFVKVNNPFTTNDYLLQRSLTFKNLWYNAVDVWRDGRIY